MYEDINKAASKRRVNLHFLTGGSAPLPLLPWQRLFLLERNARNDYDYHRDRDKMMANPSDIQCSLNDGVLPVPYEQQIFSDCADLLETHHQNVAAGRLESEVLLLESYVANLNTTNSHSSPPSDSGTKTGNRYQLQQNHSHNHNHNNSDQKQDKAAAVVQLFRGYLRQRQFLSATLSNLFPATSTSLQSRHRILLGLFTYSLLFQPVDQPQQQQQQQEEDDDQPRGSLEDRHRQEENAIAKTIMAVARLLSMGPKEKKKSPAVALAESKNISGPAVAMLKRLMGGMVGALPVKPSSAGSRTSTGLSSRANTTGGSSTAGGFSGRNSSALPKVEGLLYTWLVVFERSYVESKLLPTLTQLRADMEEMAQIMEEQVDGEQGLRLEKKASTGTCNCG